MEFDIWIGDDAAHVLEVAGDFLLTQPVLNNVVLTMLHEPQVKDRFYAVVRQGGRPIGVVGRQGPCPAILAAQDDEAGAAVARLLHQGGQAPEVASIVAPNPGGQGFVETWSSLTGTRAEQVDRRVLYYLRRLRLTGRAQGNLRPVEGDDIDWLSRWLADFSVETATEAPTLSELQRQLADHQWWLWRDGQPVAVAGLSTAVGGISRLRNVYTRPEHRRCGYAFALVSQLARRLVAQGYRCIAYGDTSDQGFEVLCQKVGYAPDGQRRS